MKHKILGAVYWIAFYAMLIYLVYLGFYEGHEGVKNIAMFLIWVRIIFYMFLLDDDVDAAYARRNRYIPAFAMWVGYMAILSMIVYAGAWITGIFWLLTSLFAISTKSDAMYDID